MKNMSNKAYILVGLILGLGGGFLFWHNGTSASDKQAALEAKNKEVVLAYEATAFDKKDISAAATYVADDLVQHNPTIPNGKEGVINGIGGYLLKTYPNLKLTEKRVLTSGDYVIVHKFGKFDDTNPKETGVAIVDIFRVKDGKIAEHWDVIQQIPEQAANTNTMF
jgi:predicted SnoaL-like aldol condensation-catalyzing enzyme